LSNRAAIAAIRRHRATAESVDPKTLVIRQEDFAQAFAELQQQRQAT
jgi:transitional endoplasmic reticulum ATPase